MVMKKKGIDALRELIAEGDVLRGQVGNRFFREAFHKWTQSCDGALILCEPPPRPKLDGIDACEENINAITNVLKQVRDAIEQDTITFNDSYYQVGTMRGAKAAEQDFAKQTGCLEHLMHERTTKIKRHIHNDYAQGFERGYRQRCEELISERVTSTD